MNTLKIFWKDAEYQSYLKLILLSGITAIVEWVGALITKSGTFHVGVAHMMLHMGFFGTSLFITYLIRINQNNHFQKYEKKINFGIIVIIILYLGWRLHEMVEHSLHEFMFQNNTEFEVNFVAFRIISGIILLLIFMQYYVLHQTNFTCSVLCHGSLGHLMMDVVTIVIMFGVSLFNAKSAFMIMDGIVFIAGGVFLIGVILITLLKSLPAIKKKN